MDDFHEHCLDHIKDNSPEDGFPITVAILKELYDFHYNLGYDIDHLLAEADTVRPKFDGV